MSERNDSDMRERAAAQEIKRQLHGLDQYIPSAPAFESLRMRAGSAADPGAGLRVVVRPKARFGAPLALAGAVLLLVMALASSAFRTTPVIGPSTSPSTVPSWSAEPSATGEVATPVPTPTPSAESLPPGVLFSGSVQNVAWSPGGTRIAVTEGASGGPTNVKIMTPDGRTVETVKAVWFAWVADDTYVATDGFATFVGHVGSSVRETISGDHVPYIPASTAGAVALELQVTGRNEYVVWSAAGLSEPRDGVPIEFSPDGTLLAVVHYPRACCDGLPSPEPTKAPGPTTLDIVRVDTGKSVRSTSDVVWAYGLPVSFSPDSRMVAFRRDAANGKEDLGILDIASGKVWGINAGGLDIIPQYSLAWLDNTSLYLRSSGPTGAAPEGSDVAVTYWPAGVSAVSVSSRGYVATVRTAPPQVVIQGGGRQVARDLPGAFDSLLLLWSPDGSTLLAVCRSHTNSDPDQVVLLKPLNSRDAAEVPVHHVRDPALRFPAILCYPSPSVAHAAFPMCLHRSLAAGHIATSAAAPPDEE